MRELILVDRVQECSDVVSFYFQAKDGGKLPKHIAGQFLPFKIQTKDEKYKDVMRTYSLSNAPNDSIYRISVKKIEGGLISSYLHHNLQVGDTIEAMDPAGVFVCNTSVDKPLVLLSGGIGITPLLSMLFVEISKRNNIHIVQAVQNSELHPFKEDIAHVANFKGLSNTVFYSAPLECDKLGENYDYNGFVTKEFIKNNLPLDADFYFCGPPVFMKSLEEHLLDLGVSSDNIHYEFFS